MADMKIDYTTILNVSGQLNAAEVNISPQLATLRTQVDGLLTQSGGLWMDQATPAFLDSYATFDSSATACCSAIGNFASIFSTFVANLQSMDFSLAKSISSPGQSASASSPNG